MFEVDVFLSNTHLPHPPHFIRKIHIYLIPTESTCQSHKAQANMPLHNGLNLLGLKPLLYSPHSHTIKSLIWPVTHTTSGRVYRTNCPRASVPRCDGGERHQDSVTWTVAANPAQSTWDKHGCSCFFSVFKMAAQAPPPSGIGIVRLSENVNKRQWTKWGVLLFWSQRDYYHMLRNFIRTFKCRLHDIITA